MKNYIDVAFAIRSEQPIPADHGYALYGAVSRLVPAVHQENGIAIHPIRGSHVGERRVALMPWSRLTLRVADGQISPLLALAGKSLTIGDAAIRVGVPEVRALVPAPTLRSRLVVIKVAHVEPAKSLTDEQFTAAVRKQLDALGVSSEVRIILPRRTDNPEKPRRRTLRVKHRELVGYEVILEGLSAEESLTIQSHAGMRAADGKTWVIPPAGLGGKRHMGTGVFVPCRDRGAANVS